MMLKKKEKVISPRPYEKELSWWQRLKQKINNILPKKKDNNIKDKTDAKKCTKKKESKVVQKKRERRNMVSILKHIDLVTGLDPKEVKKKLSLSKSEGEEFDEFIKENHLKKKNGKIDKEKLQKLMNDYKSGKPLSITDADLEEIKKQLKNRKKGEPHNLMEDFSYLLHKK